MPRRRGCSRCISLRHGWNGNGSGTACGDPFPVVQHGDLLRLSPAGNPSDPYLSGVRSLLSHVLPETVTVDAGICPATGTVGQTALFLPCYHLRALFRELAPLLRPYAGSPGNHGTGVNGYPRSRQRYHLPRAVLVVPVALPI